MITILFNGPPGSGKDTAAKSAMYHFNRISMKPRHSKFAQPLKDAVHSLLGIRGWYTNQQFEDMKNEPHQHFYGMTPREAYIAISEQFAKPFFGSDVFVQTWLRLYGMDTKAYRGVNIVSDLGFEQELKHVVEHFLGSSSSTNVVALIRIHRDGHDYSRDSRSYVDGHLLDRDYDNLRTFDIYNVGTLQNFQSLLRPVFREITACHNKLHPSKSGSSRKQAQEV